MEWSIFIASMLNYSHLGTIRFAAAHVDHFSKATVSLLAMCSDDPRTFSVETISMYTVLKIGMFGIQGITFTYH